MTVVTGKEESQPLDAEQLVRTLGAEPPVSQEFRERVLAAASQAAVNSKRQKGWVIATSFAGVCAVCVLLVAAIGFDTPAASGAGNGSGVAAENATNRTGGEDAINRALINRGEVISGGMVPQ